MTDSDMAKPTDTSFALAFGRLENKLATEQHDWQALGRAVDEHKKQQESLIKLYEAGNRSYHLYKLITELSDSISSQREHKS